MNYLIKFPLVLFDKTPSSLYELHDILKELVFRLTHKQSSLYYVPKIFGKTF